MTRPTFVEALVEDLTPVRPAGTLLRVATGWTLLAWLFVVCMIFATGSLRDGAVASLASSARYAFEFGVAVMAGVTALVAGLELGVPGREDGRRMWVVPLLLLSIWIAVVGYGVIDPVFESGHSGLRPFCDVQTILFALPPLALALFALRRRALFASGGAGFLLGLGAGAIPSAAMQFACLYDPSHALVHHLTPIVIMGGLGGLIGWSTRRRV